MFRSCLMASLIVAAPLALAQSPAALKAQLKKVTAERDELKARLAETEKPPEELAAALRSRDLSREEAEKCQKELEQIRASFKENRKSGEDMLQDIQKSRTEAKEATERAATLEKELEMARKKLSGYAEEGDLVVMSADVLPAKPMNLHRVVPQVKKVSGVVVINVLVSEKGEVLASHLLQPLPGEGEWVQKAHDACIEAAKRVVFDPARVKSTGTKVKVWQGLGFLLD